MSEGSAWSDDAYEINVQLRGPKTVLVEGKHDKWLVERVLSEKRVSVRDVVVDTSDMIFGEAISGLGNKEKVLKIWRNLSAETKSSGRIIVMIDREWDGFDRNGDDASLRNWVEHTKIGDFQFQTLGHSAENYGFRLDFIIEYIKHFGCGIHSSEIEVALTRWFPSILSLAVSFSLEAKERGIINRCGGVFSIEQFDFSESVQINGVMAEALRKRGIQDAGDFVTQVNSNALTMCIDFEAHTHLLAHGHLGEDLIWAGVGALLKNQGLNSKSCVELAFSRRDERIRFYHGWLSKSGPNDRRPIDELVAVAVAR